MKLISAYLLLVLAAAKLSGQNLTTEVLVVYHSEAGHTASMAAAVAAGARSVEGVRVAIETVEDARVAQILEADAIVIGSPVYNANVTPEVQRFVNRWPIEGSPLRNKLGAAFVTGGGISAGEEAVQLSILRSMLVFGMVVVGGHEWTAPFGASAVTQEEPFEARDGKPLVEEMFLRKGRALGRRVAELARRWKESAASGESDRPQH